MVKGPNGWFVALPTLEHLAVIRTGRWNHPFVAVVETDVWFMANVDG